MTQTIDSVYRDWATPSVPSSGDHKPRKPDIRALLKHIQNSSGQSVTRNTYTALAGVTPPTGNYMGVVLGDPDATKNGYYSRVGSTWIWVRGFPDTFAALTEVAGTASAITANAEAGVNPADMQAVLFAPVASNTASPVTLAINGGAATPIKSASGANLAAGDLLAGVGTMLFRSGSEWRQLVSSAAGAQFDHQGLYSDLVTYTDGQIVSGSDNKWYRLTIASSLGDDPVDATGDWLEIFDGLPIADGSILPVKLADSEAIGFRMAANARGRVNFFDFLQDTRSSAVREAIMNGTSTADLATEWGQFRDALWDIYEAGGRAHGFIPECMIHSSVAPNFAMDNLTLETQGLVRVRAIGAANGFVVDGEDLGVGGYGVRNMNIGPMMVETAVGSYAGYFRKVHQSEFRDIRCGGAVLSGFKVDGCVSTVWRKLMVSSQPEAMIATPNYGLQVTGVPAGQTSFCLFDMPIFENVPFGVVIEYGLGNSFVSGTAEACSNTGLYLSPLAQWNKFYGMDMEANDDFDIYCEGLGHEFFGTDAAGGHSIFTATAAHNRVFGGTFGQLELTSGSVSNRITGINYNANGSGYLADAGLNVLRDNYDMVNGDMHSGDIVGSTAIDITTQGIENSLRTWTNPYGQAVTMIWGALATSAWIKTAAGTRYELPAGGGSALLAPGDKVQLGYVSAPDAEFRFA